MICCTGDVSDENIDDGHFRQDSTQSNVDDSTMDVPVVAHVGCHSDSGDTFMN